MALDSCGFLNIISLGLVSDYPSLDVFEPDPAGRIAFARGKFWEFGFFRRVELVDSIMPHHLVKLLVVRLECGLEFVANFAVHLHHLGGMRRGVRSHTRSPEQTHSP